MLGNVAQTYRVSVVGQALVDSVIRRYRFHHVHRQVLQCNSKSIRGEEMGASALKSSTVVRQHRLVREQRSARDCREIAKDTKSYGQYQQQYSQR
jgi:hypothetical protein